MKQFEWILCEWKRGSVVVTAVDWGTTTVHMTPAIALHVHDDEDGGSTTSLSISFICWTLLIDFHSTGENSV